MAPNTDRDTEATAAAETRARQIVGRVVLQRVRKLVETWDEEETAAKRLSLRLTAGFLVLVGFAFIVSYALSAHPKVQLFILALGIGIIAALAMIVRSGNRKR